MSKWEVVLCNPVRTAIGTYGRCLKTTPAVDLGAAVVRETLQRSKMDPARLNALVMGNMVQAGNKMDPARQAAIHGGVPVDVPAMTVNRACGFGTHPIAAPSAIQTTRLFHSMKRDGLRRGVVTLCSGGRQGIALALEISP